MSVLLSGKGTVNVKSSVSVTTTHTGTGRAGREGRAWPARAPGSPAVAETKAPESSVANRWRGEDCEGRGMGGGPGDTPEVRTTRQRECAAEVAGLAGAAHLTPPTQIPGPLYALGVKRAS